MNIKVRSRLLLEVCEQVEDLGLDHEIERSGRLVGDEEERVAGQGHCDQHPLSLATRQLMWIGVGPSSRAGRPGRAVR